MALLAGHDATISHLLFAVPLDVSLSSVNSFGDQVMFGKWFFSAAKFAATVFIAFHAAVILAFYHLCSTNNQLAKGIKLRDIDFPNHPIL